jgi:hypothetical protein
LVCGSRPPRSVRRCAVMAWIRRPGRRPPPDGRSCANRLPESWHVTFHRRYGVAAAAVCVVLHRSGHPPSPPRWRDRPPRRRLDHPAGPQPAAGAGRAGPTGVLSRVRRRVQLRGCRGAANAAAGTPTQTPTRNGGSAPFAPSVWTGYWSWGAGTWSGPSRCTSRTTTLIAPTGRCILSRRIQPLL